MIEEKYLRPLIELAFQEDIASGDVTTEAIFQGPLTIKADFISKEDGILAGIEVIDYIISNYIPEVKLFASKKDGTKLIKGTSFAVLEGDVRKILTYERTLLNFLQRMCGVATLTNNFVQLTSHTNAKILDTRKTIPGWRYLDKLAVRIGGAQNHRFGLFDMFLIKENHIQAAGGIEEAIKQCKKYVERKNLDIKIEVEVQNLNDLKVALNYEINRIMLDNFSIEEIREAVNITGGKVELEVSGGVKLENVKEIAETGVDFISVGFITHSAKALDISLEIE